MYHVISNVFTSTDNRSLWYVSSRLVELMITWLGQNAWRLVDEDQYMERDITRMPHAKHIDCFQVGDLLTKCCEPYGNNKFLLNKTLVLKHKHYDVSTNELLYIVVSDNNVDGAVHLKPVFFSGWLNQDLLMQCPAFSITPKQQQSSSDISVLHQ
jgi:hypothetical protein